MPCRFSNNTPSSGPSWRPSQPSTPTPTPKNGLEAGTCIPTAFAPSCDASTSRPNNIRALPIQKRRTVLERKDNGLSSSSLFGPASSPTTNAEKQAKEIHPDPDNPRLLSSPNAVGRRSGLSVHRTLAAHLLRRGAPKRNLTKDELYSIYAITEVNLGPPESTSPCTVLKSSKGLPRGGQATLTGLEEQTKDSDDHLG